MITQSVGVPRTAKWRGPTSRSRKGSLSDSECDTPDWSSSGATTQTSSDNARAISSTIFRPGAWMPSSLVQRIRIRSNALSTDSNAANAPSYPSRAVEANPANTIEMAHSTRYRVRRHVLSAIGCDFSLQWRTEGRGGVSQHFHAGRSRRFADSDGIGCRRSGPNTILHIEEKCSHCRHLVCDRLNAKITDARRHPKRSVGVWGLVPK